MRQTPEEAYKQAAGSYAFPVGPSSNFLCPHCNAYTQQRWGTVGQLTVHLDVATVTGRSPAEWPAVCLSRCSACDQESVFVNGSLVHPDASEAPVADPDLPELVEADFQEARQIFRQSPRGAAALLRLTIQKLLPLIGATQDDINTGIGELVAKGIISRDVQQALDSVRVIGNEAVHPGVMDLRDDKQITRSLFELINIIVRKAITEPKQIAEIYDRLPANKRAGIVQRDARSPPK